MKLKRFGALCLSLALTLSLAVLPARAVEFSDLDQAPWAKEYINRMVTAGLAQGYPDGTYLPNRSMTAAETLLFCARLTGVDAAVQKEIAADHAAEVSAVLPATIRSWPTAANELAVAIEAGVLTLDELKALSQVDPDSAVGRTYLDEAMDRQDIARYLVRAMQLESIAMSSTAVSGGESLSYPDKEDIAVELRPYAWVLTNYGVIEGVGTGDGAAPKFEPKGDKGKVTRAQMATMLCRSLDVKEKYGIVTELSEYTDFDWVAGTITAVVAEGERLYVTLTDPLSGTEKLYTLPADVKIYDDNMLVITSAPARQLRTGRYVRLNLDSKGAVEAVRLCGELTRLEGTVNDLVKGELELAVTGHDDMALTIDRFTQVAVGQEVGDRTLIDYEAGYDKAVCYVDKMGHLSAVRFSGGTQVAEGLIESVTTAGGVTTLGVAARNGILTTYTIPAGAIVTVNGISGTLNKDHVGRSVKLRVNVEDGRVTTVAVNSLTRYVQGPIRKAFKQASAFRLVVGDRFTGKDTADLYVDPAAIVTYNGETVKDMTTIEKGWYVTAVVAPDENGTDRFTLIEAYPASTQVEGVLADVTYASPTLLRVTLSDGTAAEYSMEIDAIPPITRNGKTASITELRKGDTLKLTLRYNTLEKIEATAQAANEKGTITGFSSSVDGVSITVRLSDGTVKTYPIPAGTSVSQNGVLVSDSNAALNQPGATVELVTEGDAVLSVNITAAAVSSEQVSGTIYTVTVSATRRTMTVLTGTGATPVTVDLSGVQTAADLTNGGQSMALSGLKAGDRVTVYGSYSGATFVATVVIKQ